MREEFQTLGQRRRVLVRLGVAHALQEAELLMRERRRARFEVVAPEPKALTAKTRSMSFVFSSRRRHRRLQGDWSSDVCSSDLGGFPAATRAVAEWFPVAERSSAMGIINAGTALGAVAAPPLIALILTHATWRWVFFITGGIGLIWTILWWTIYFVPERPQFGHGKDFNASVSTDEEKHSFRNLLRLRHTWGLTGAKFLSDAAWYFYLFWLPKYLYDA